MRGERLHAQSRTRDQLGDDTPLEDDISEAHSVTDAEAWHLFKLGSSTLGKEFQVSYELN